MRIHQLAVAAALGVIALSSAVSANTSVVMQRSNLRGDHDRSARIVEVVEIGRVVTVESPTTNGYQKVTVPGSGGAPDRTGWILAKNLADSLVVVGLESDEPGALAGASKAEGCNKQYSDYSECPMNGCGTTAAKKLFDTLKNTTGVTGNPRLLTFADFHALEDEVEKKDVRGGAELSAAKRQSVLHNVKVSGGTTVSEGDSVSFAGYISTHRNIACGSQESCNCDFKNSAKDAPCTQTDIHIPLVETADLPEEESVVVELTPRVPSLDAIRDAVSLGTIQSAKQEVLVVGRLFFDNAHIPNPTGTAGSQPKRFTIWEVHPIAAFYVCQKGNTCDPSKLSDWKDLSK